ncbi:MAG: L-lactate dehydrogenase [Planctomycetaceae bacterium]
MKVGIVGSGLVGSTAAYAMVMQGVGREIILVDNRPSRALAEADDIFHAVPFSHPLTVRAGEYSQLAGCRVVVVTAGVNQKPGETRLALLQRNADVFREVIPQIVRYAADAVLVVATNPVDIMTHVASEIAVGCGVPQTRVFGSGTTLDTARFRTLLGEHFGVDSRHVHAYVIGEHGDSEVLAWSHATIGGLRLPEFAALRGISLENGSRQDIDERVRRAAYRIIEGKGSTYYGIGSALAQIVNVLLHDQRSILTICSRVESVQGVTEVTISMPHLIGGNGVMAAIPLSLTTDEAAALKASAAIIKDATESLKEPR